MQKEKILAKGAPTVMDHHVHPFAQGWKVGDFVFTGGIGENGKQLRRDVCANLQELGIELDEAKNDSAKGEASIHSANSKTQLWVIPTNEEIIVARQTKQLLEST